MKPNLFQSGRWRAMGGVVFTVLIGLALSRTTTYVNASYDLPLRFASRAVTNRVVLVEMDTAAYAELHQTRGQPWNRALHAGLLDYLREDGCPLVVFDIWFHEPRELEADKALVEALRRHGNVALMARLADPEHPRMMGNQVIPPHPKFREAATNWGVGQAMWEADGVVRKPFLPVDTEVNPTLPWTAARLAGARLDAPVAAVRQDRWLRYYAPKGAWTQLSYHYATNQAPEFFRDKVVFVGNRPETPLPGDERDEFRTPNSVWSGRSASGMEILATTFLNLVNRDWLRRMAWWQETLALVMIGTLAGMGSTRLSLFRWPVALGLGLAAAAVVAIAGVCLSHFTNWWFPWLVVAGGQIPVAVGWACFAGRRLAGPDLSTTTVPVPHAPTQQEIPHTPGYERIEPAFGKGAYGKVWLVRNAIGEWQALKVMFRASFGNSRPYDREFNGIKHYKPISSQHPGLLRIDYVSAMQPEGYFYYVMELGDALSPGWEQNHSAYQPRDLASACRGVEKNRLPLSECVRIGLALAESLDFLHQQGFIHRDIKPSNVIFVKGHPKLADVGLVTEMRQPGREVSYLGTDGYIGPEGPGEPQGDIYSLGMLLYVISTGQAPSPSLDLSATMLENSPQFMLLNRVICKACHPNPLDRYASAAEMCAALSALCGQLGTDALTRQE